MAAKNSTSDAESRPFGAVAESDTPTKKKAAKKTTKKSASRKTAAKKTVSKKAATKKAATKKADVAAEPDEAAPKKKATSKKAPAKKKAARKAVRKSASSPATDEAPVEDEAPKRSKRSASKGDARDAQPASSEAPAKDHGDAPAEASSEGAAPQGGGQGDGQGEGTGRRRRRRRRGRGKNKSGGEGGQQPAQGQPGQQKGPQGQKGQGQSQGQGKKKRDRGGPVPESGEGMFVLEKGGYGVLRQASEGYRPSKQDVYVSKNLIQKHKLRDGMLVTGKLARGQKHKFQLVDVHECDGKDPKAWKNVRAFKGLTSIDPDFHYATGDPLQDTSMRIVDLLCPIGRGQRGLIVAPPRSGKTTLLRTFAKGIEEAYPDVHLMVLLVDERPEEATEWTRSVQNGQVFSSTSDETAKAHIQLAEAVWKRCMRLVEMGEDVVLLLDSLTRLARAFNNQLGSGKTMSGGLDSRAMERPRKIFGSARNTVEAGSLTILGTILVDTGSKMDQLVFEDFKGTGNMELVLNRKLADRRVFPAIDVERSGTRKEEKLVGLRRLKQIHTLRRVLSRLHYVEAVEMLITRLDEVEKTDDFLNRFTIDPEA